MQETAIITVEVVVGCDAETAWDTFTNPQRITEWNFASDDWCCPRAESDLRVGGSFSSRMEARDGAMGFDFGGTFMEVVPRERLRYALGDGREVLVEFRIEGEATRVTESFAAENTFPLEQQKAGWQAILDNFKRCAEQHAGRGSDGHTSADEREIRALVSTWREATQAGDIDTVLSLMTDDVVFLLPGREPVTKAEFETLSRMPPGSARPRIDAVSEIQEIGVAGDLAFMRTKLCVKTTPAAGGEPTARAGHTLSVLRRVEGRWRLARDANLLVAIDQV